MIGTTATVRSGAYGKAIRGIRPEAKVVGRDCPLFVPLVENGLVAPDNEITRLTAKMYLEPFFEEHIDTLILGCTHYPILRHTIGQVLGERVRLVNPAFETAKEVKETLRENNITKNDFVKAVYRYYVSDAPEKFRRIGGNFLKKEIELLEEIQIDSIAAL